MAKGNSHPKKEAKKPKKAKPAKQFLLKNKKYLLKGIAQADGPSIAKIQQNFMCGFINNIFYIFMLKLENAIPRT